MLLYLGKLACRSELGRYPLSIGTKTSLKSYLLQTEPWSRPSSLKGRTIRKVLGVGGWGKDQKIFHARENVKKKNSCKEEGKEKKFMQKEGPIVTFSESLSFFQKVWVSEINNITRHNMNKQKSLSSYWKETIKTLFLF